MPQSFSLHHDRSSNGLVLRVFYLLFFFSFLLLFIPPLFAFELQLSDTSPQQGDIVLITVANQNLCELEGQWNSNPIHFRRISSRKRHGLVGIDYELPPGDYPLTLHAHRCDDPTNVVSAKQTLSVRARSFRTQRLTIPDDEKVNLSSKDLRRVRKEKIQISRALASEGHSPVWSFPAKKPVSSFQPENSFGSRRIINGQPRSPHSGEDYSAEVGHPIHSIMGGTVALTGDFFFSGKSIFMDHGGGLKTMYFHLSDTSVKKGDWIEAGEMIGQAGMTGRVTGPHLHLGMKIGDATVDPDSLFSLSLPE